ncbi:putative porin [Pseudocnuella soli]|uniref:putative porin n=1 Tax=Pseudocnuella soli TaxID=2502779 RepID=UPI00104A3D82|nr:putative porin [Pseudocnuella soli]
MQVKFLLRFSILFLGLCGGLAASAQAPGILRRLPRGGMGGGGGSDSLERRSKSEDSVNITYRLLDSTFIHRFDSSLNDFSRWFPVPPTHRYLGNTGTATQSLLFEGPRQIGFDPGFHSFDAYKWRAADAQFFTTSRPYTQLGYLVGGQQEQHIEIFHTQNIRPYWNFSLRYRLINSPGFFRNQRANHNNYQVGSWYESPNKRYNNYFVLVANALQAGENGGILGSRFLDSAIFSDRFTIPTRLGGSQQFTSSLFGGGSLATANRYNEVTAIMRQQYDLGRKDSLVTDTSVIPLFYPRLRFEHTLQYKNDRFRFYDQAEEDTTYYETFYKLDPATDSVDLQDRWIELSNDFSIYQFPDAKNLQQFLKAGIQFQFLQGTTTRGTFNLYNLIGHGEYRNRTRNRKWEIGASGRLHLNGFNAGDYHAFGSLQRNVPRLGNLLIGGESINRSPSFAYDTRSSFYFDDATKSFSKENTTHFFGSLGIEKLRLRLTGDYFLISNYLYLKNFYELQQEAALFNVLRIGASKQFRLSPRWSLYSDVWVQQKTGDAELNIPLVFTRNRLVFEGTFFRRLNLATGLEMRYHTPYEGDDYSPVLGRYFYQQGYTINNRPDVAAFFNFRIRTFRAFVRAENLNSFEWTKEPGFTGNNMGAPEYPYPGLVIRFGINWTFLN